MSLYTSSRPEQNVTERMSIGPVTYTREEWDKIHPDLRQAVREGRLPLIVPMRLKWMLIE